MFEDNRSNNNAQNFVIGTVVGGVIGSVAALLLAPKTGYALREDIADKYEEITDAMGNVVEKTKFWEEEEPDNTLLWGGIAGSVLAAAAALLLVPKKNRSFGQGIVNAVQGLGENGKDQLRDLVAQFATKTRTPRRKASSRRR